MFWSYFAYARGTNVFSFKKLFLLILSIPLTILICVVSSGLLILFFRNWATAANIISYSFSATYRIFDLVIIGIFLFFVYSTINTKLNAKNDREFSVLSFFYCVITALVFLLFASAGLSVCNSLECREKDLKSALGEGVYQAVEKYLKSSPVILKDLGQVKKIANQSGQKVRVSIWLDYDAKMNLELTGDKGTGFLELMVAGNNSQSLEIFDGIWKFDGNSTPIGFDGNIDYSRIKFEQLNVRKNQLEELLKSNDCNRVLELIAKNESEVKQDKAYNLDHLKVTYAKATCFEKSGDTGKAADAFASYSFFSSPHPFQEKAEDIKSIETAKNAILKAMKLNPDYKYFNTWQLSLDGLEIQEKLTSNPCDENLRNQLRENLVKRKIRYTTLPVCRPSNSK